MPSVLRFSEHRTDLALWEEGEIGAPHANYHTPMGSLQPNGALTENAADAIADVVTQAKLQGGDITVLLPARMVRARRVAIDIACEGQVTPQHLTEAMKILRQQTDGPRQAILYRQPTRFLQDAQPCVGDPVGQRADVLTLEASILMTSLKALSAIDRCIKSAHAHMADVVTPHITGPAYVLGREGQGTVFHIGYGDAFASVMDSYHLMGAGQAPIGVRHIISDIAKVYELSLHDAALRLENHGATPSDTRINDIISARVGEILKHLMEISRNCPAADGTPITVSTIPPLSGWLAAPSAGRSCCSRLSPTVRIRSGLLCLSCVLGGGVCLGWAARAP